jgi:hypothetical protein
VVIAEVLNNKGRFFRDLGDHDNFEVSGLSVQIRATGKDRCEVRIGKVPTWNTQGGADRTLDRHRQASSSTRKRGPQEHLLVWTSVLE